MDLQNFIMIANGLCDLHIDRYHEIPRTPQIYWELNWMNQWDPRLINFIKQEILIAPPTTKRKLNLQKEYNDSQPWIHHGQHGEVLAVEYLNGLDKMSESSGKLCYPIVHA